MRVVSHPIQKGLLIVPEHGHGTIDQVRPTVVELEMRGRVVPFQFIYDRMAQTLYVDDKWLGWSLFSVEEAEKHAREIAKTTMQAASRAMFRQT